MLTLIPHVKDVDLTVGVCKRRRGGAAAACLFFLEKHQHEDSVCYYRKCRVLIKSNIFVFLFVSGSSSLLTRLSEPRGVGVASAWRRRVHATRIRRYHYSWYPEDESDWGDHTDVTQTQESILTNCNDRDEWTPPPRVRRQQPPLSVVKITQHWRSVMKSHYCSLRNRSNFSEGQNVTSQSGRWPPRLWSVSLHRLIILPLLQTQTWNYRLILHLVENDFLQPSLILCSRGRTFLEVWHYLNVEVIPPNMSWLQLLQLSAVHPGETS